MTPLSNVWGGGEQIHPPLQETRKEKNSPVPYKRKEQGRDGDLKGVVEKGDRGCHSPTKSSSIGNRPNPKVRRKVGEERQETTTRSATGKKLETPRSENRKKH